MNEQTKSEIIEALNKNRLYNPHNVTHHAPDFYPSKDERYKYEIHIVKWNTRSSRMTILLARFDEEKKNWIFTRRPGLKRTPHGEKMR